MFKYKKKAPRMSVMKENRRPRRFAPTFFSIQLEDRRMLSGAGVDSPFLSRSTPSETRVAVVGDGTVSPDGSPTTLVVIGLYRSILLRNPTVEEIGLRGAQLRQGRTVASLQKILFASSERAQLISNMGVNLQAPPREFVESLYSNILSKQPNSRDMDLWVRRIRAGTNRQVVVQTFLNASGYSWATPPLPPVPTTTS
jgi:hypothetical protein